MINITEHLLLLRCQHSILKTQTKLKNLMEDNHPHCNLPAFFPWFLESKVWQFDDEYFVLQMLRVHLQNEWLMLNVFVLVKHLLGNMQVNLKVFLISLLSWLINKFSLCFPFKLIVMCLRNWLSTNLTFLYLPDFNFKDFYWGYS